MATIQSSWPTRWLMTDERLGDRLGEALDVLPEGAGVVLRHYRWPRQRRLALAREIVARGLVLSVAGDVSLARDAGAELVHRPASDPGGLPFSMPVHDEAQARAALGAALVFVSPIYATASHPGAEALGVEEGSRLAAIVGVPAIALGGVDEERFFAELEPREFYGWAGIGAWLRGPSRE